MASYGLDAHNRLLSDMLRKSLPALLATTLVLVLATTIFAESPIRRTVRIVTLYGYAPYCFTVPPETNVISEHIPPGSHSATLRGYSWDIVRTAFHNAGYEIELTVMPWKRSLVAISNGEFDLLFPASPSSERKKRFAFGRIPINDVRCRLYVRTESLIDWNGLQGLPPITVAVQRGFNYGDRWENLPPGHVRKKPVDSIRQDFDMLLAGRVDAFAGYEANWDFAVQQLGIRRQVRKLPVFENTSEYAIALKNAPNSEHFLSVLNEQMFKMFDSGWIDHLREEWSLPARSSIPAP